MMDLMLPPVGLATIGPRMASDGPRFEAWLGSAPGGDAGVGDLPEPMKGVTLFARGSVDLRALTPAVELVRGFAGGNAQFPLGPLVERMTEAGIIGEDAMRASFQIGTTDSESVSFMDVHGARAHATALGLPAGPLGKDALRAIPADATLVSIKRVGVGDTIVGLLDQVVRWTGGMVDADAMLGQFRDATGVDVRADILDALGDTQAFYMSDTTGGGSLLSATLLMSIDDREKIEGAFVRLASVATGMIAAEEPEAARYLRIQPWDHEGHRMISLRADGLPVPLELTMGFSDGWLVLSPTPQGAIAALAQAGGSGRDITSVQAVREALGRYDGVGSLTYMDTPRFGRAGYAMTNLVGTAIQSAMRSPSGGRDPGMIVPAYHQLMDGARPSVQVSAWRGDDYIVDGRGDRSLLVNMSGMGGMVQQFAPIFVIPAMAAGAKRGGFSSAGEAMGPALAGIYGVFEADSPAERFALAWAISSGALPRAGWDLGGSLHDAWSAVMLPE